MAKKDNLLFTQISGGKYKGKKLALPSLETTRSTKSILKESFFDSVQFEMVGKNFIEVFGGSGSMGLEALSRGAKEVYFIEKDHQAYAVLKKNASSLDALHTHLHLGDSFELYPRVIEKLDDAAYLYFDPPFDIREGMEGIYERVISLIESTPKEKVIMIVIEHMTKLDMPEKIGEYRKKKFKKFGRSALSYYIVE
jgi:16S rRNA (guanine(966)-N(2))-methyltransferase RsmD